MPNRPNQSQTRNDGISAALAKPRGWLVSFEPGRMWVDARYCRPLQKAGLTTFQAVMKTTSGRLLRALPDRENWWLELHDAHRHPRGAFLKKHHTRTWVQWLRAKFSAGPGTTPGRTEASNIARLEQHGIAAMRLIAYGEKLHADGLLESFVMTEELAGYRQLDHFLRERFAVLPPAPTGPRDRDLLALVGAVAEVARKFHRSGYNHRDLYCCHFFVREPAPGRFQVNLIDLQRVQHRRRFRRRWLVKDLAQLAYSVRGERISRTHQMAFIKRYLGVRKLGPHDKRLIRQVLAKSFRMQRRLGAHP